MNSIDSNKFESLKKSNHKRSPLRKESYRKDSHTLLKNFDKNKQKKERLLHRKAPCWTYV